MENFLMEEWLFLYQFALVELAQARMSGRVSAAQQAIAARLERLRTMPELHREERQAMEDTACTLTFRFFDPLSKLFRIFSNSEK